MSDAINLQACEAPTAELSDQWQDIATAPKDGTWILGFESRIGMNTKYTPHEVMRWVDLGQSDTDPHWRNSMNNICEPTHWQRLPAPPWMSRSIETPPLPDHQLDDASPAGGHSPQKLPTARDRGQR